MVFFVFDSLVLEVGLLLAGIFMRVSRLLFLHILGSVCSLKVCFYTINGCFWIAFVFCHVTSGHVYLQRYKFFLLHFYRVTVG